MYPVQVRLLLLIMAASLLQSASAQDPPPIIDAHMHAASTGSRATDGTFNPIPCMPAGCEVRPTLVKSVADLKRLVFEAMDRNNIVMAVLSGAGSMDTVYEWAEARPNSFLSGYGVFDPVSADTAYLREEFEAGRLHVIGEIAAQYMGYAADEPELEPLFELAESLDLPVLIHTAGTGAPPSLFRISDGHPERLQEVLESHPDLRLWLENAAYPFLEEVIALMYRYPKVYADVSTIGWVIPQAEFWRYLEALMTAGLGKRIMWGSDQSSWPGAIEISLASIQDAPFLTEEQKRDILYNNAVEFFQLELPHFNE